MYEKKHDQHIDQVLEEDQNCPLPMFRSVFVCLFVYVYVYDYKKK